MLTETGSWRALGCRVSHLTAIWSGRMSTPPAFPICQRDPKGGQWGGWYGVACLEGVGGKAC